MASHGRKPIPASLIDAAEHKKSKEEIAERQAIEEGLKTTSTLACPSYLSKEAKREWKRVMDLYNKMDSDILCDLDIALLVIYCEAWSVYREAQKSWKKYNQIVATNPDTQRILSALQKTMDNKGKIIANAAEQLCLTPIGRARMGMAAKRKETPSELDTFLDEFRDD